jgi:predicted NodU family carbamoyl transferase
MKILGINISHDFSVCVYEDKKIINFFMEERYVMDKGLKAGGFKNLNDNKNFIFSIFKEINFKPDLIVYTSFGRLGGDNVTDEEIIKQIQKQLDNPPYYFNNKNHHIYHACSAFYFSNFSEAMAIVIDGGGSCPIDIGYQELQSIFYINKNKIFKLFQHLSNLRFLSLPDSFDAINNNFSNLINVKFVKGVEYHLSSLCLGGMNFVNGCRQINMKDEPGKLMGLSSYAYTEKKYDLNYQHVKTAKNIQEKTFYETCEIIDKAYDYKKIKNFVLSGGYFLNCSNNFKYVKKYPEFNFFVDPNPTDGGTSIGACIYYDKYK